MLHKRTTLLKALAPFLIFFVYLFSGRTVLAEPLAKIDVNNSEYEWKADSEADCYYTTVELYVGDTFTDIVDSSLESKAASTPQIQWDYGNCIAKYGKGTYQVIAAGRASKTYISKDANGWRKKTIRIVTHELPPSAPLVSPTKGKYSYETMEYDLQRLVEFHKDDKPVKLMTIGTSLDKRSLYCLQIGNPDAKKKVLIVAGLHGREYMNPYFVMDNISNMLANYYTIYDGSSYTYAELYDSVCLYVIPMANPDGVSIAQRGVSALRNKTLRKNAIKIRSKLHIPYSRWKGNARNVDLNRNFSSGWVKRSLLRKEGSSGSKAGSEPETKSLLTLINTIKPSAVVSFHSTGECFYWGYAISKSSTCYKQALAMSKICARLTGYYKVPAHRNKSYACGCLEDWLAYKKKIPSLCIETGIMPCPLSMKEYPRIYAKNQYVIEEICNYFKKH